MTRISRMTAAALLLSACTSSTATPVHIGQAGQSYVVECSARGGSSTRGCLAEADTLCPQGYDVVGSSEPADLPYWRKGTGTIFVTCSE